MHLRVQCEVFIIPLFAAARSIKLGQREVLPERRRRPLAQLIFEIIGPIAKSRPSTTNVRWLGQSTFSELLSYFNDASRLQLEFQVRRVVIGVSLPIDSMDTVLVKCGPTVFS